MNSITTTIKPPLKALLYWLVPPGITSILKPTLRWWLLPGELKRELRKNVLFKNKHAGERCFILATGPSIANQDLSKLKNETCFAVGEFYLHKSFGEIAPKYNVQAPNHPPFGLDIIKTISANHKKNNSPEAVTFFGHAPYENSYFSLFAQHAEFKPNNACYLNYSAANDLNEFNFKLNRTWDITRTPFLCRSVVYCALQLAIYMGFSKIYLLGCDHDYLMTKLSDKSFENHHFYHDDNEGAASDGIAKFLNEFTLEQWFKEYYFRWMEYRLIRTYAEERGQLIFNATKGGMLDVFPRVDFEKL